jgi:formylglycine-generating enzyme required for sulfatase activity
MMRAPAWGLGLLATAAAGCSPQTASVGLLLKMTTDGSFPPSTPLTKLHVDVGLAADPSAHVTQDYPIPPGATDTLGTLGIKSNGNQAAAVVIDVSLWSAQQPLDVRRYEVTDVPTTTVEEVDVVFSAKCQRWVVSTGGGADSSCGSGRTCDPTTGLCGSDVHGDTDAGEGEASAPADAGTDSPSGEASLADAGGDGSAIACAPDASPRCSDGGTPQQCIGGQWVDQAACLSSLQYCSQGACQLVPPSCQGAKTTWECASLEVPPGTFYRGYDGVTYTDASSPATVHGFRLDAYEVTVGRFQAFVEAFDLGPGVPEAGAGKHSYLNDGGGLVVGQGDGGPTYETGWDPSWTSTLPTNASDWFGSVRCSPPTLTTVNLMDPDYPLNCVTWYAAYAFCIYDQGFLPTEAEWEYAASGGQEQRVFPWGSHDPGLGPDYAAWGCYFGDLGTCLQASVDIALVNQIPMGVARWGQWNMAGNMAEWTLDGYQSPRVTPCVDCTVAGAQKVFRGGSFGHDERYLYNGYRAYGDPTTNDVDNGFRCARPP